MLCYTVLYYDILSYPILCYTILHHTITCTGPTAPDRDLGALPYARTMRAWRDTVEIVIVV